MTTATKQVTLLWGRFCQFSFVAHPAGGMFKTSAKGKRKTQPPAPPALSPDSVRLRGGSNNDLQRKNPAP